MRAAVDAADSQCERTALATIAARGREGIPSRSTTPREGADRGQGSASRATASSSVERLRCRAPSTAGNVGQANPPDSIRRARRRNAGSIARDGGRSESGMRQDGARGGRDAATGWGPGTVGGLRAGRARPRRRARGGSRTARTGRNFSPDAFGSARVEAASRSIEGVGPEGPSRDCGRPRRRMDSLARARGWGARLQPGSSTFLRRRAASRAGGLYAGPLLRIDRRAGRSPLAGDAHDELRFRSVASQKRHARASR